LCFNDNEIPACAEMTVLFSDYFGFAGMTFFANPDEGGICTRSAVTTTRKNKD